MFYVCVYIHIAFCKVIPTHGKVRDAYTTQTEIRKGRNNKYSLSVDGRMILKWAIKTD
jgi:hypothetical protein